MKLKFPSRITGGLIAVAIAATTFTATPAFADREDERAARAIATLLGLAVVGKIIHENSKGRSDKHVTVKKPRNEYQKKKEYAKKRVSPRPKPLPQRAARKTLPRKCFRAFETRRGQVTMFARRCLERNYRAAHSLPSACAKRIRTDRGTRYGYGPRCLRNKGYRVSQRW